MMVICHFVIYFLYLFGTNVKFYGARPMPPPVLGSVVYGGSNLSTGFNSVAYI